MSAETRKPVWVLLTSHWLSMAGAALVTTAVISWLFVLPQQLRGHTTNPYAGIVDFLILPVVFFLGLALIPIGVYLGKRRIEQGLAEAPFDRKAALGRLAWFFGVTTVVNVLIGTQITYRAVQHMETPQFCGQSCHPIHGRHFGPGVHIRFAVADAKRQTVPWVEYRNAAGQVENFVSEGTTPESVKTLTIHDMQCVDCHNRPTHAFESASRGLNNAMATGEIPTTLPFLKKKGMELLNATYKSNAEAGEKLPAALVSFYQQSYPDLYAKRTQDVQQAAQAVLAVYNRNVFPDMKVTWGTYPNNLGHTDFPGCFRCHDGSHMAPDGKSIVQDCDACHQLLATDEAAPEILKTLGLEERLSQAQKK